MSAGPPPPPPPGDPAVRADLFKRAQDVYDEVVALSPADRAQRVAVLCAGDDRLRVSVNALLEAEAQVGGFLEAPVLGRAFDELKREADTDEARDEMVGAVLGPFRLEKRLASGGMGTVYLGLRADDQFSQRVAIKVVKRGMDSEEILRRFREERQTLAQLDHPNIARLLDAGVTPDGRPYLVMEFVDGVPIDRYCDQNRLSIAARVRLFRHVCDGVHAAHQALVIHRDLKPSNILVTAQGVPKLLDFGIAKVLSGGGTGATHQTIEAERRLTPEYASPEQVEGGPITTASDVYSLGVVLYELLTGRRPYAFTLRNTNEIRQIVCGTTPVPPSEAITRKAGARRGVSAAPSTGDTATTTADPDHPQTHRASSTRLRGQLRGDLDTIVMMALRKEPPRRYASAEQLSADLGRYLVGLPVSARRDTWLYRSQKFVRRNAPAVAAGLVAVALLIAGLIVRTQQRNQIAVQRDELAAANARLTETRRVLLQLLSGAQTTSRGPSAPIGEVLLDAAALLEAAPPSDQMTLAGAREAVGSAMMTLDMTARARPLLQSAFDQLKSLPADSEQRLEVEAELAQLLYYEGKYAEAEQPLRDLLARERARNNGVPTALEGDLLNALGAVLRLTNRFDEALKTQQNALTVRSAVFGADSLAVAESRNNVASIHLSAGRAAEAADEYRVSLSIREKQLRAGHPLLLATRANLGQALVRAGKPAEAVPLLRAAADGWTAAYGDAHGGRAAPLTSLGLALIAEGKRQDATAAFGELLDWQLKHGDAESPAVLATRVNIAVASTGTTGCEESVRSFELLCTQPAFEKLGAGVRRRAFDAYADALEGCGRQTEAAKVRERAARAAEPR